MSDEARIEKLIEWHKQGFSVLGRFGDEDEGEEQSAKEVDVHGPTHQ
jgi:hypothetical protein